MNKDIIIMSSSTSFTKKFNKLLKKKKLSYPIIESTGNRTIEIANQFVTEGAKIIITRGKNLSLLRQNINTILIDVRYTYEDIYFSLKEAKNYSNKIAYIGFDLAYDVAAKFKAISKEDFLLIQPDSVSHVDEVVKKYSDNGIEVFIGGITVANSAKKYGVKSIMIDVDEISLDIALNEAISLLNFELERRKNYETITQILNSTTEGIIGIDQYSRIRYINDRAKKFITDENNNVLVDEIVNLPVVKNTIKHGTAKYNELLKIGNTSLILNSRPLKIDNNIFGAVASIQKSDYVQSAEKEIRKNLNTKGHIAKKNFNDIIGKSKILTKAIDKAKKFAKSDSTILITGPSGAGKEIFAQSIHNYSNRHNEPFVAINCAALPKSVLESELFGYVKGAFTGARPEGKTGIFELAHNGTVFLDEIGETSQDIQVKLLRVIQEKEVIRIGDDKVIPVNVRIISATNKNLLERIEKNEFREDLYYRLCVLELRLPSLDQRKDDIPLLIKHFISNNAPGTKITNEALQLLGSFPYAGNIRHLQNTVERLIVMCENNIIDENLIYEVLDLNPNDLEKKFIQEFSEDQNNTISEIGKIENQLIKDALKKYNGNKTKVARELGMSYTTLWRRLKNM
ncbi:transcriptional regulator with PAS, ATPase and Fis domain [Clostridium saccharoperbutylacetonicum]|uniref:Transcriptional regulator containing PAS, AAA-type ATPase, and DNA-binding domains n=2 Tax=Clostridium TaxID=1485 RepID=M1MLI0_9CLOT|nr:sigma 54-interacting transcriptional regulator [Clostridium saccharoperbutylacetonicum]AGF58754.1 transcriptional regulator containing PAS, AAA-type ATPase, and DNA-binding domains [Clostridium saccharoperbutylacetonicum N1-4(HMT)]NRT60467.1 transcriptional regulator with PAS, ATPase and Fis domain [Clostridium saccharoperbutylacetonicum]NSB23780.1 transcriptional regulator with PAS, ATPase and Fis domain [Clostridium saccharoperbutylacetonicum]NSB43157.1 transcriptional regulator with PAS, 